MGQWTLDADVTIGCYYGDYSLCGTPFLRPFLLGTVVIIKLANSESCVSCEPTKDLLVSSKKTTMEYIRLHKDLVN